MENLCNAHRAAFIEAFDAFLSFQYVQFPRYEQRDGNSSNKNKNDLIINKASYVTKPVCRYFSSGRQPFHDSS